MFDITLSVDGKNKLAKAIIEEFKKDNYLKQFNFSILDFDSIIFVGDLLSFFVPISKDIAHIQQINILMELGLKVNKELINELEQIEYCRNLIKEIIKKVCFEYGVKTE